MHELRVVGVEEGALLVASDSGETFRLRVDEVFHSQVRRATHDHSIDRRLSPKEIQAHIRAGMSADDVAAVTGAPLDYIQRFEGPVLAERAYVVESALGVAVHTAAAEIDPLTAPTTFGSVIRERLADLNAVGERWASWKEEGGGWIVKLAFSIDHVDHDARWSFDPKKHLLSPLNTEATSLSQQEDVGRTLIPRLRAVSHTDESSRFDSAAFTVSEDESRTVTPAVPTPAQQPPVHHTEPLPHTAPVPTQSLLGMTTDPGIVKTGHTADLLEALRRRRGEREAATYEEFEDVKSPQTSGGGIRLVDVPLDDFPAPEPQDTQPQPRLQKTGKRSGRVTMPSWDEIVFGARPDDLA
ncbi:septation protein SepH [Lysobacter korlensis]|uniref:Septation protein SepH n=1 Tax=Lysobacter korlensis TaxID=553636 RepID=A0ABV6RM84_9GAMM